MLPAGKLAVHGFITIIGLAPANPCNLAYALGTPAVIVLVRRVFRGFMATVAVLAGLVLGTLVAWLAGDATFASVGESSWFGVTTPFFSGGPRPGVAAIASMIVVMLITAVETTRHAAAPIDVATVANHRFGELVAEAIPIHGSRSWARGMR